MNNFLRFWYGECVCLLKSLIGSQPRLSPGLTDLPPDVIVDILMRLPIQSIYSLRCASKTFSDIVDSPLFAQMHMSRSLNSGMNPLPVSEVPQLMLYYCQSPAVMGGFEMRLEALKYDREHGLRITNYNLHPKIWSMFDTYDVEFVFYNLFFFTHRYSREGSGLMLNPLRGEAMKIPLDEIRSTNYGNQKDYYGMGYDITANAYKMVCVSVNNHDVNYQAAVRVYVLGQSSWRKIGAVPPAKLSEKYVCAHGDVHWFVGEGVGRPSNIISFDITKEEFCWTPHPTLHSDVNMSISRDCHLLNYKGNLAIVDTEQTSSAIFVKLWSMKDYGKKEWSLDYDVEIDKQSLGCKMWVKFSSGEWENGIFFALADGGLVHYRPSVCYFLDLKRNSITRVQNACSGNEKRIFGYTASVISLKGYNNLEENVWVL